MADSTEREVLSPEERLRKLAEELQANETPQAVRIRDFLGWFGARRRGFNIVERIRRSLVEAGLQTTPDFEEPHIDANVFFALLPVVEDNGTGQDAPDQPRRYVSDPIWRVRRLRAADKPIVSVAPTDSLEAAVTKMLLHDYSQLPVLNGRELKGAITWTSIGMRLTFGNAQTMVKDFMVEAHRIEGQTPLLQAIPEIVANQYVLVLGTDKTVTGIVTTSDLSEEFREQAEPFLLLREIEHQIRQFLLDVVKVSDEELSVFMKEDKGPDDGGFNAPRPTVGIHDLTFGDYVRFLEDRERWSSLKIPIDRAELVKKLHRVREIRNSVMHFDPDTFDRDPLMDGESAELADLRRTNSFFQKMLQVLIPPANPRERDQT